MKKYLIIPATKDPDFISGEEWTAPMEDME